MKRLTTFLAVLGLGLGLAPTVSLAQDRLLEAVPEGDSLYVMNTLEKATLEETPVYQIATEPVELPYAMGVATVAYSAASEIFYFWLDEFSVSSGETICTRPEKFAIRDLPENEELIAQVKMAFLSGKQLKATWMTTICAGSAPVPHYIKVYR